MDLRTHLLSSAALALGLYPRRPTRAALLLAGGVLIDLDHLLLYALRTGDWSVSGALRYNRYRHQQPGGGDTRPRYGPLRSWLHQPWLLLPPVWALARRRPAWRPLAIGLSLHLLLDYLEWPWAFAAYQRAGGRCVSCGASARVESRRRRDGAGRRVWLALCPACAERPPVVH